MSRVYGIPVRRLQQELTSAEFAELMADYIIEPWGDDWQQAALIATAAANANPYRRKPLKFEDVMPGRKAKPRQTVNEIKGQLNIYLRALQKQFARRDQAKQKQESCQDPANSRSN